MFNFFIFRVFLSITTWQSLGWLFRCLVNYCPAGAVLGSNNRFRTVSLTCCSPCFVDILHAAKHFVQWQFFFNMVCEKSWSWTFVTSFFSCHHYWGISYPDKYKIEDIFILLTASAYEMFCTSIVLRADSRFRGLKCFVALSLPSHILTGCMQTKGSRCNRCDSACHPKGT